MKRWIAVGCIVMVLALLALRGVAQQQAPAKNPEPQQTPLTDAPPSPAKSRTPSMDPPRLPISGPVPTPQHVAPPTLEPAPRPSAARDQNSLPGVSYSPPQYAHQSTQIPPSSSFMPYQAPSQPLAYTAPQSYPVTPGSQASPQPASNPYAIAPNQSPGYGATVPTPPPTHILEVGKYYSFVLTNRQGDDLSRCKVIEVPRDGWVKVKTKDGDKSVTVWINLSQVSCIFQGGSAGKAHAARATIPSHSN